METKAELVENWSEWLLRRIDSGLSRAAKKDYIKMALKECAKDYAKAPNVVLKGEDEIV